MKIIKCISTHSICISLWSYSLSNSVANINGNSVIVINGVIKYFFTFLSEFHFLPKVFLLRKTSVFKMILEKILGKILSYIRVVLSGVSSEFYFWLIVLILAIALSNVRQIFNYTLH